VCEIYRREKLFVTGRSVGMGGVAFLRNSGSYEGYLGNNIFYINGEVREAALQWLLPTTHERTVADKLSMS
jgi:hypothetical protein